MSASLPYLVSPGSIKTALEKIRSAATPERVTGDFVTTKLQIKGGTGAAIPPFLKKIGLANSDGTPTELYSRFRNPSNGGTAIAEAIKHGYKDLSEINEYFYELNEAELKSIVVQATGLDANNNVVKYITSTLKNLKVFADFEKNEDELEKLPTKSIPIEDSYTPHTSSSSSKVGLNLSYTINLNLPASTDQAVFNAIFKSLKEHLLDNE